ncbi:ABC transporter ATP-binding protein [Wukongibacter sp. M2B1]|uniref:ABC transporter ATP-binding protein n=1 Tax=Wukongibacter sp. M2B1 TaxID=3088895 RepID=UPI003D7AABAC
MLRLMYKLYNIAGDKKSRLRKSFVFQLLECLFASAPYVVLLFVLRDIMQSKLTQGKVMIYTICLVLTLLIQMYCNYKVNKMQSGVGYDIVKEKRILIGDYLRRLSMGYFAKDSEGELISAVTSELSFIEFNCMSVISKLISSSMSSLIAFIIMLLVDYRLAIVAITTFPIAYYFYRRLVRRFDTQGAIKQKSQYQMLASILEYINGVSTLRAFNRSGNILRNLKRDLEDFKESAIQYEVKAVPCVTLYRIFINIGSGLILLVGALMVLNSSVNLFTFLLFIVISLRFYQPIEIIATYYGVAKLMDLAFDNIEKILSSETLTEPENDNLPRKFDIRFNDVSFSYDKDMTLKHVNAHMKQNEITALVGPSGSGKTTLTSLIARFYDVNEGQITIGNVDIRDMKYDTLLSYISVVFQDVYLFNDTLYNNIRFGNENATRDEVIEAAKKANCHEFIENMVDGYDTVLGEGGNTLSGGEKQRISIARAILKDAPIILLDEATASVDPENEIHLQRAITELTKGKTLIIIAHKLSHIKDAHQILVMDKGYIVQRGRHHELIEEGQYRDFWERRAKARS